MITKNIKKPPVRTLVYGPSKIGKTTLCASFHGDRPSLIIAADARFYDIDIEKRNTWIYPVTEWKDLRQFPRNALDNVDSVCIDSITELFELREAALCKQHKVEHISQLDFSRGYAIVRKDVLGFIGLVAKGKYLLLTAAEQERERKGRSGVVYKYLTPALYPSVWTVLQYRLDMIAHAGLRQGQRILDFRASQGCSSGIGNEARRLTCFPDGWIPLDGAELYKKVETTV